MGYLFAVLILLNLSFCTAAIEDATPYGISPQKVGYIPARMAVVNCMTWPERSTRIYRMPLGNVPVAETNKLCEDFDQYVASSFDNQPFMKGVSSKYVEKLYSGAGMKPALPEAIAKHWQHQSGDCSTCRTPAAFYTSSIAARRPWQVWLASFAQATKGCDAILIPLILHNSTTKEDDRGMAVAKRSAAVVLVLIDTTSGELIWSGGREADVVNKTFKENPRTSTLEPPDQNELKKRLFTDALWLGFPGRQVYK